MELSEAKYFNVHTKNLQILKVRRVSWCFLYYWIHNLLSLWAFKLLLVGYNSRFKHSLDVYLFSNMYLKFSHNWYVPKIVETFLHRHFISRQFCSPFHIQGLLPIIFFSIWIQNHSYDNTCSCKVYIEKRKRGNIDKGENISRRQLYFQNFTK